MWSVMKLYDSSIIELSPSRVNAAPIILVCKIATASARKKGIMASVNKPMKKNRISFPV